MNGQTLALTAAGVLLIMARPRPAEAAPGAASVAGGWPAPHFHPTEFYAPGRPPPADLWPWLAELARRLEVVRAAVGHPIGITSGYRTPEHNAEVHGASRSYHVQGRAADIHAGDAASTRNLERVIRTLIGNGQLPRGGGLAWYPPRVDSAGVRRGNFVHYDTRSTDSIVTWPTPQP